MEVTVSSIVLSLALVTFLSCAWKAVNWAWLRPKEKERCLRGQGFKGNPYRLLFGDTKEFISVIREAKSKPMDTPTNDIVPRVLSFHQYFSDLHGKNYFAWIGPTPRLCITDPKLIKEIFFNYEVFQKPAANPLSKLLVTGILAYEGEKWATHRNLVNPAFHLEKLKNMVPTMYASCCEMTSKWEVFTTKASCELDVWPYLDNLTGDVISRTAFGSSYEEGRKIFELQKEQAAITMQRMQSIYIPGWRFLPTKTNNKIKKIYNEVGVLMRNIINKQELAMKGENGENYLLGILLKSNLQETRQQLGNKKNVSLTTEDVIEECKLFYLAGQETTSGLLAWTMVLLSKHEKWQALAREEVLAVIGDNNPDFDGLNQLKIVTMILYEVLRLYTPAASLLRATHEKAKLGDLVLPAGVEICVPTIAIHHDPEIWGKDANEFKPERFSEGISKATKGQGTFFPFGGGPRICIGQNFSLVEAKIALAVILILFSAFSVLRACSFAYLNAPTPTRCPLDLAKDILGSGYS